LYDAQFREYGIQGRWPSPDPAGLAAVDPANPQSWNRYAYVMNSPEDFVDPLGLCGGTGEFPDLPCPDVTSVTVYADSSDNSFGIDVTGTGDVTYFLILAEHRVGGGGSSSGSTTWLPQAPTSKQACGPAPGHPSMGVSASASTVNPFTSGNGGIWGGNQQSFGSLTNGYTSNNYTYSGKGFGLDVGASVQSVWAWGSGSWTGPFHSVNVSLGPFSGSIFWTPGKGGWTGFSFGLGVSPPIPQAAYEVTNYTCKSGPG
jgi:hypothetical protein